MTLTDSEVAAALARAEAATAGPWKHHRGKLVRPQFPAVVNGRLNAANAAFIAHARDDVPALARDLMACRDRVRDLEAVLTQIATCVSLTHPKGGVAENHPVIREMARAALLPESPANG